jgi:dipeptidyl aminopeptidase/acylaminoacyl peptidase
MIHTEISFIVKEDFVKLLNEAAEGREVATIDERCTNITAEEDPISGITKNIKDINPSWSPDGKLIAFSSNRSGRSEIWIMEDDGKSKRQLSSNMGTIHHSHQMGKNNIHILW